MIFKAYFGTTLITDGDAQVNIIEADGVKYTLLYPMSYIIFLSDISKIPANFVLADNSTVSFRKASSAGTVSPTDNGAIETTGVVFDYKNKIQAAMKQGKRVKIVRTDLPALEIVATQDENGVNKYLVDDGSVVLGIGTPAAALGEGELSNDFYLLIENFYDTNTGYVEFKITNLENIDLIMATIRGDTTDYGSYNKVLFSEGNHLRVIVNNTSTNWDSYFSTGLDRELRAQVIAKVNTDDLTIIFKENVMDGKMTFVNDNLPLASLNYALRFAGLNGTNQEYLANVGANNLPNSYTKMVGGLDQSVHTNVWYYIANQTFDIWAIAYENIDDDNGVGMLDDRSVAWKFEYSIGTAGVLNEAMGDGNNSYEKPVKIAGKNQTTITLNDFNNLGHNDTVNLPSAITKTVIELTP